MKYKILLALSWFCFPFQMFGQECPASFERGVLFNSVENTTRYFCYKWDPELPIDSIPDVYHTRYTIALDKGRETYTVHFYFYKKLDSISIKYINEINGKIIPEEFAFKKNSSIRIFKNYKANDSTISENEQFCTLFTIPDIMRPYVTLNLFRLPDNPAVCLEFTKLSPEKLYQHRDETALYYKWEDSLATLKKEDENRKIRLNNTIDSLLKDMDDHKTRVIQKIREDDTAFKMNGPVQQATSRYQEELKQELDPLFIEYLEKEIPFENTDSEIRFTFIFNGDGKMETDKTQIEAVNSLRIKWVEDGYKTHIQPHIGAGTYKTVHTSRVSPGLVAEFNTKYAGAIDLFRSNDAGNEGYKIFIQGKNRILNELDRHMLSREISTPTRYTYSIRYRSEMRTVDWIYEIDRKGVEKIGPKKSEEIIPDELKAIFKKKIAKPGIGKYHISICKVYFNGVLIAQDIRLEEIKK